MKLFEKTGKMAIGSRMRLLTARLAEDVNNIYKLYEIDFSPKWFPVFFALAEEGKQKITEIATYIGHSQPSVTKIVKEMTTAGLCAHFKSSDKRQNTVGLTAKGIALSVQILPQYEDTHAAVETLMAEANHDLWEAIQEWEMLLEKKSLFDRVKEEKRRRESKQIKIIPYQDKYLSDFKSINEQWISTYFEMEEGDYRLLNEPRKYILDKGGKLFVALYKEKVVGVCSLLKIDEHTYEMAKMAVLPEAQGRHIGWLLGKKIVAEALELGATRVILESNTALKAAIKLYEKLGFKKVESPSNSYKRVDIHMELELCTYEDR